MLRYRDAATIQLFSLSAELTTPQQLVLSFIEERSTNGEPPPTYREICKRLGYKSPKAAADHVAALERKGLLIRTKRSARGLRSARQQPGIPMVGRIAAGVPRDAFGETGRRLPFDPASCGIKDRARAFALEVAGDSMVGRQIFDGDIVILEKEAAPHDGDVVAALIDNESTLKTFVRKGHKVWLRAENPQYPDLIPALDLQVQGVARAVIRLLGK